MKRSCLRPLPIEFCGNTGEGIRMAQELGERLKADPDTHSLFDVRNFLHTVERYNGFCAKGEDEDFHRPQNGLDPIGQGPFHAVKLWPGGPNTQGGPRKDVRCQVIRPGETPIRRLHACGEMGSFLGMPCNGSGNLAGCIAMGRVAGKNAAEEPAWA